MVHFLLDVNMPYYFSLWNTPEYVHMNDIGKEWEDLVIFQYAVDHSLTIITKDQDFSSLVLLKTPSPKIIHFKTGNLKMRSFFDFVQTTGLPF
jgi:predicted nuclease of predicted toxin-antitoxin system